MAPCSSPSAFGSLRRKPTTAAVALAVLEAPQEDWTLSSAADRLGMGAGSHLSRRLMQEGESFREVTKAQRLTRLFLDLASSSGAQRTNPGAYGFRDRCQLENAFYDHWAVTVDDLSKISLATEIS